jgi:hypothetical protein
MLCLFGSYLRKDSKGGVCARCRAELVFNGLVDAARARRKIRSLSRRGVGRDAVSAAADLPASTISAISRGTKTQIRALAERRILAVDGDARADASTVPAAPTWKILDKLLSADFGFTKTELARRLGYKGKPPALQIGCDRVLARTALNVERFYRLLELEDEDLHEDLEERSA